MNGQLNYLAANERAADMRRAAADHRRAQSVLMNKAESERRDVAALATRRPLLRRLLRTA